jgi:RNA polymerase sigma-54 factor
MSKLKQNLQQKQLQKLSPQQIQFIQLLQLNTTELEKRVEEELNENPAIDSDKDKYEKGEQESTDYDFDEKDSYSDSNEEYSHENEFEVDVQDYVTGSIDEGYAGNYDYDNGEEKKEMPFATTSTLYDVLNEQLAGLRINNEEMEIARHLIGMLEEDGYLRRPLKNISYDLTFLNNIKVSEEQLEKILFMIQTFEPAGIGARSLEECLLIQLRRKDQKDKRVTLATKIIANYMEDLAKKHYEKLLKNLKIDRDELKEVIELIVKLNPKPGESQINTKTQYIIPDFLVSVVNDELQVSLNSRNAPDLKINREYQDTMKSYQENSEKSRSLKNQVQFIKQKLDSAKWFIDAIKQRQHTLIQTMRTIVSLQKDFFLTGDIEKLQPMILKDIADKIGMDISTISRVASSKYVQTDFGIFSLKEFFSEGIATDSGEEVSNKEVKHILQDFISKESKTDPLTDEKLTDLLNEKGYNIARRTVAKYREQLGIPVARLRKEL